MTCPHATPISAHANACGLNLYGGRPSKGVCAYCISRGENTPEHAARIKANPPPPPSIPQMATSLGGSLANFARSGFTATDPDTLASRMDTCKACDLWDAAGMAGTGRCRKCGCSTQAKLRMASEKCPIGKW
jgi:hypothetical protein